MRLPDTLEGALMLSAIDFILSFVVIAGIGVVLALLPLLNRLARKELLPAPAPAVNELVGQEEDDHVAAISAAVYAMIGPHRIVQIELRGRDPAWSSQGRRAHHGSHALPRGPSR
jgi:hypothetical protein